MGANARLAQWESACLTRRWSQVQILHRALSGPERGRADRAGWRGYYRLDRSAPFPDRPALCAGHRNSLARRRRATASSDASVPSFCERGASLPFTLSPRSRRRRTSSSPPFVFSRSAVRRRAKRTSPTEKKRGNGLERRPPVGIAARRAANRTSPTEKKRGRARERRPPVGTRAADGEGARPGTGTPVFRPAPRPAGPRTARC